MAEWRHAETLAGRCDVRPEMGCGCPGVRCSCTTPTPDPASPCGYEGCEHNGLAKWTHGPSGHPHVPTTCLTCGHGIEADRG